RRHTRFSRDWSSDVCSSDLGRSNAWDYVEDDPALPRVLLIGDSVSRGYTQAVRKALQGKVNVHRAPANCGPTATGLKKMDVWLEIGRASCRERVQDVEDERV